MLLLLRFFTFFKVFFKIQKVVTFYVFCRVSYVFSNYGIDWITLTFDGRSSAIGLQSEYSGWHGDFQPIYAKYISEMISNTAMVTTIIENRIIMICCRPTFLRYRAIIHTLLSRAYLASARYFLLRMQHSRALSCTWTTEWHWHDSWVIMVMAQDATFSYKNAHLLLYIAGTKSRLSVCQRRLVAL